MPPRKRGTTLDPSDTKVGEPVPKGVIDTVEEVVGVPHQVDPAEEIAAIRGQLDDLRLRIAEATSNLRGGARLAARQAQVTAKLYPMSSVLAVAGLTALFVLAVGGVHSSPPRSRTGRVMDELQDLYERARRHF